MSLVGFKAQNHRQQVGTPRYPYRLNRVMSIDAFVEVCGYFTTHTDTNNGYGCLHPENEEQLAGDTIPRCCTYTCPLAYERNPGEDSQSILVVRRTPDIAPLPVPHDGCGHD